MTFSSKRWDKEKGISVELKAAMSGHVEKPIYKDEKGTFYMNPFAFYDRVVETIHKEFKTYLGESSKRHVLSTYEDLPTAILGVMATVSQNVE